MRQRFQGKCFVAGEGYRWMHNYDSLPEDIRKRLRDSPFNICAACVLTYSAGGYHRTIDRFEAAILAELGTFGPQPVNPAPLIAKPRKRRHVENKGTAELLDLPQADPDQAGRMERRE